MTAFRKWKSIGRFSDAVVMATRTEVGVATISTKIKLHGTNAGIRLVDGISLRAQKRSADIFPDNDNAGFAKFVMNEFTRNPGTEDYDGFVIYGEWAGNGIQKSDAVSQITKTFFVFGIYDPITDSVISDPEEIQDLATKLVDGPFHVIPWMDHYTVNFSDQKSLQVAIDSIVDKVEKEIAVCDPYIQEMFDVEGPGEGVVGYVTEASYINGDPVSDIYLLEYIFKVKTEAHTVEKTNKRSVGVVKPEGTDDFVATFVTDQRCEQMLAEIGGKADRREIGKFLKAVMTDIHKESKNEILIADFEFKDVAKYVQHAAKVWFFAKEKEGDPFTV